MFIFVKTMFIFVQILSPDKISLFLWKKNFLREINRNVQTFAFKVHQECSCAWASRNGAAQMTSGIKQKHVCWKICKVRKVFGSVSGAFYIQCKVSRGS